jgi:hypothetical protein
MNTDPEDKHLIKAASSIIRLDDFDDPHLIIERNPDIRYENIVTIDYWKGNRPREHSFIINVN